MLSFLKIGEYLIVIPRAYVNMRWKIANKARRKWRCLLNLGGMKILQHYGKARFYKIPAKIQRTSSVRISCICYGKVSRELAIAVDVNLISQVTAYKCQCQPFTLSF